MTSVAPRIPHPPHLPFTIRVVNNDETMARALQIRQAAYQRHVPEFARFLDKAEKDDRCANGLVLLAELKADHKPVGTMRIQSNCLQPLALEESVTLPTWLSRRLVGATRLGIAAGGAGHLVRLGLFKALYCYCLREKIDWMTIAARPPLDRIYSALLFQDVFGEKEFLPLVHAAGIPHRIMALNVNTVEQRWKQAAHRLCDFMFSTDHVDIDLTGAPSLGWSQKPGDLSIET